MNKREVNFETTVIDYLSQRGYVRRRQLIDYLIESHSNDTGYSEPSINRKLANMHKAGLILLLKKQKDLDQYGIKKEPGNVTYVIAKNSLDIIKHLDYVFGKYRTGNIVVKKTSMEEIKRYDQKYVLSPSQLDIIILDLDNEDDDLINSLLEILYNQIINKEIKPRDEKIFLGKLRNLLERYPERHKNYSMLRRRVIWLLGYYNDKAVLDQLIKDTESGKLSTFQNDYMDKFTAKVIEIGRTELFDLEIKLKEEGDTETAKILSEIRNQALSKVEEPTEPDEPLEAFFWQSSTKAKN